MLTTDISATLAELDTQRIAMGMSYQDVADACGVSKPTIYRALTGATQATAQLLQDIAAAVQYKPESADILPDNMSQETYVGYLKGLLRQQEENTDRRVKQLHSHYNKLRRQDKRRETVWMILAISMIAIFVVLFVYDFANRDRGWIQDTLESYGLIEQALLSIRNWWEGIWV